MFENYVGQDHIKKMLGSLIEYHKTAPEPLQHTLITGASGLGKTRIANEIANALGTNFVPLLATTATETDLIKAVCSLNDKDLLFLDELQSANKKFIELLFPIMAEGLLYVQYHGTMRAFRVSKFTIIGATDRPGLLNPALLNRFQLTLNLKPYTTEEFVKLIKLHTSGININDDLCVKISKLCKGVPRILINILGSIKIYLKSVHKNTLEDYDLETVKEFLGIDSLGLDHIDLTILKYLSQSKMSLKNLANVCGCLATNIENLHEPYLIQLGFIECGAGGRSITQKGLDYLKRI